MNDEYFQEQAIPKTKVCGTFLNYNISPTQEFHSSYNAEVSEVKLYSPCM